MSSNGGNRSGRIVLPQNLCRARASPTGRSHGPGMALRPSHARHGHDGRGPGHAWTVLFRAVLVLAQRAWPIWSSINQSQQRRVRIVLHEMPRLAWKDLPRQFIVKYANSGLWPVPVQKWFSCDARHWYRFVCHKVLVYILVHPFWKEHTILLIYILPSQTVLSLNNFFKTILIFIIPNR